MSKVYEAQTDLRIRLQTGLQASDIQSAKIKYKKPDGTTSEWNAIVDAADGSIYYDVGPGDIDQDGTWVIWAYVTTANGDAPGEAVQQRFNKEGT